MINTNTTKSIRKTSTVLGEKCESTRKNMKKLMATAGAPEYKTVKTMIPRIPGERRRRGLRRAQRREILLPARGERGHAGTDSGDFANTGVI